MSQLCGTAGAFRGLDFPHLIDFGVVGALALLLLLDLKTAYDMRIRGEAPPGKSKVSRRQSP
jgi:hypothetical protein